MIDTKILKSIFSNYSINKVVFIEEDNFNTFLICSMSENISLERWNNLESILKEYSKKEVSLLPFSQAYKYLKEEYISKGVIIEWIITDHFPQ